MTSERQDLLYLARNQNENIPGHSDERRLWWAVLDRAIMDITANLEWLSDGQGILAETNRWFNSDEFSPGSFLWVCEQIDVDVEAVLKLVNKLRVARDTAKDSKSTISELHAQNQIRWRV